MRRFEVSMESKHMSENSRNKSTEILIEIVKEAVAVANN